VSVRARQAIIDIGSNSVRLVVYNGPERAPIVMFNEKVMAGLGRDLATSGVISGSAMKTALKALARFRQLVIDMGVEKVRAVATAAVRDASNGSDFLSKVKDLGLDVELLSGEAEAIASGYGVISADPGADGIVGDLGGGSLELIRIKAGEVRERASFPLGVLRIDDIRKSGRQALDQHVRKALRKSDMKSVERDLPFFLVGGSWRALGRLHMQMNAWPLPVAQAYQMDAKAPSRLLRTLGRSDVRKLKASSGISSARLSTLADSAALLAVLVRQLGSAQLVVSSYGLREGLLYQQLSEAARREDPLVAAAHAFGEREGRFPEHGDVLNRWLAPLFEDDSPADRRLRHIACLLADVGWLANPEFRSERGLQTALHGNWVGIDARGRAMVAHALYVSFGGSGCAAPVSVLASADDIVRAGQWGLAIRLGQRFSGGVAEPLAGSKLGRDTKSLSFDLGSAAGALYGEAVERRHRQLANAMNLTPEVLGR
jgi:exopolyphosphatase / guanosine-5'-triphosphate,3'-diphosphate pyrophosphatase